MVVSIILHAEVGHLLRWESGLQEASRQASLQAAAAAGEVAAEAERCLCGNWGLLNWCVVADRRKKRRNGRLVQQAQ